MHILVGVEFHVALGNTVGTSENKSKLKYIRYGRSGNVQAHCCNS